MEDWLVFFHFRVIECQKQFHCIFFSQELLMLGQSGVPSTTMGVMLHVLVKLIMEQIYLITLVLPNPSAISYDMTVHDFSNVTYTN